MSDERYAFQKTSEAVRILAASQGEIRERLSKSWAGFLSVLFYDPMPWNDLQEGLKNICEQLKPEISEDNQPNMENSELHTLAGEIVDLHYAIVMRMAN